MPPKDVLRSESPLGGHYRHKNRIGSPWRAFGGNISGMSGVEAA